MAGRPVMPLGTFGKIKVKNVGPSRYMARARFRDPDGVTRPVVRFGQTKGAAEAALREHFAGRQRDVSASIVKPTTAVSALADIWEKATQAEWSSTTTDTYGYAIANQVKPELGSIRLAEIRPAVVSRALTRIKDSSGPSAAKTAKTVLAGMFDYAIAQDAMQANPARVKVRGLGSGKKTVRALTPAEVDTLTDALRSDQRAVDMDLPDLVEWMLGTGARIGEVQAARIGTLDQEHGTWEINATLIRVKRVGLVIQERPKSAAGWRVLALPPYCVAMLERRDSEARLEPRTIKLMNERNEIREEAVRVVFPAPAARSLRDPRNTSRELKAAMDRLGFEWVTSHIFRKTVATRLDEAGLSARQIADQLGHAKPSMTQDVYMGRKVVSSDAARILDR